MSNLVRGTISFPASPSNDFLRDDDTWASPPSGISIGDAIGNSPTSNALLYTSGGNLADSANLTFSSSQLQLNGSYLHSPDNSLIINSGDAPSTTTNRRNSIFGIDAIGDGNATTAYLNSIFGYQAGKGLTSGYYNCFFGAGVGANNTTGHSNVFVGYNAGATNSTGTTLTFVGTGAGENNTGSSNAFFGYQSGNANTSGSKNTFTGYKSGLNVTTGSFNTFTGYMAGWTGAGGTGTGNTFIGSQTVALVMTSGYQNTMGGLNSGNDLTTGNRNAVWGYDAGSRINSGYLNSILGHQAGQLLTTGYQNILIGALVGDNLTTGYNNILIGYNLDASAVGVANELNIGGIIKGDISGTPKLGVFDATPIIKQTLTGSDGGNAALQNLISILEDYGWLIDNTTTPE